MSSSDHRGVPQGNAAIIAAIIGGIALINMQKLTEKAQEALIGTQCI